MQFFAAVADERSFSRAAAKLGMSPSALSQTLRKLEFKLGAPLLVRTTRSLSPTEAAERLLAVLRPALDGIDYELMRLRDKQGGPAGSLRIATFQFAARAVLVPMLPMFLGAHPGINVEVCVDSAPVDIVANRFTAGIRFLRDVDRDMIAVRVSPDLQNVVVASPEYIRRRGLPANPNDLEQHECIGLRLAGKGALHPWVFRKDGLAITHHVTPRLVFNDTDLVLAAALAGGGLAYRLEPQVSEHVEAGRLVSVLDDWRSTTEGLHIYYPGRRAAQPALQALVEAIRWV